MFGLVAARNLFILDHVDVLRKHRRLVTFDDGKLIDVLILTRAYLTFAYGTGVLHQLIFAERQFVLHTPILWAGGDSLLRRERNDMHIVIINSFLILVRVFDLGLCRCLRVVARIVLGGNAGLVFGGQNNRLTVLVALAGVCAIKGFWVKLLQTLIEVIVG